jgi:hypothetical protein
MDKAVGPVLVILRGSLCFSAQKNGSASDLRPLWPLIYLGETLAANPPPRPAPLAFEMLYPKDPGSAPTTSSYPVHQFPNSPVPHFSNSAVTQIPSSPTPQFYNLTVTQLPSYSITQLLNYPVTQLPN